MEEVEGQSSTQQLRLHDLSLHRVKLLRPFNTAIIRIHKHHDFGFFDQDDLFHEKLRLWRLDIFDEVKERLEGSSVTHQFFLH